MAQEKEYIVDIITLFEKESERTVEELGKIYRDNLCLRAAVDKLIGNHFNLDDIQGKSVLIKPNWVREELKETDYLCLRTNDNLLLAVLQETLAYHPSKVLIADAPVQGCIWEKMITEDFLSQIKFLEKQYNIPIFVKDFRRTVTDFRQNKVRSELHPMSDYVIFDVGEKSFLESITTEENRFRITWYNPDHMAEVHHKGVHKYCIAKDFLEYDVVITMPKIKTHRMAGMTNAMKLLIGINGDKDYLPHHRIGSINEGGDNYKDKNVLRTFSNYLTDCGNRRRGTAIGLFLSKCGSLFWRLSNPDRATLGNAGWYGNDTIWRTIMDVNTIALYGDRDGILHNEQQRKIYIIMDGIIGGQGDGPLHPEPTPLGVVAFSNNPYLMDVAAGFLYHLNLEKIPQLKEAKRIVSGLKYSITINGRNTEMEKIRDYGIDIKMSPGWLDYNK